MSDQLTVFSLGRVPVRGRIFRTSKFASDIVKLHGYPDAVNSLLRETMAMNVLFSSLFKIDGIFSVQINGKEGAAVKMLACDVTSDGDIRAYASFDENAVSAVDADKAGALIDGGHIIFTVDNTATAKRYQGIVEVKEGSICKSFVHYFNQSEQIPTSIQYFSDKEEVGALILQDLPEEGGHASDLDEAGDTNEEDDWNRVMVLASSCTKEEFFDENLSDQDLLFRLFHEEEARVFDPLELRFKCRCSADKAERALYTMTPEELKSMAKDGTINMSCEFCNSEFVFDPEEIASKM